jgi:cysteinyl-tRNA synthetase
MNHALWVCQPSWEPYTEEIHFFDFRYGPDPDNVTEIPNDLMDVITRYWSRNTIRPSNFAETANTDTTLAETDDKDSPANRHLTDVSHWLYLIDVNLEDDTIEQIIDSDYDMVVLDFIPSEANNTDYPMTDVVEQLHNAPHPKLVIAYIDIGQAEDFRTYWQPGWQVGNPEWIVGDDPDGWEGNYPVRFWWDEWQDIWLGSNGTLQAILDAGFDGIYLDWVEAYSDENVVAAAASEGIDPRQEMIWFVGDMAEFARNQNPEFIVIGQNAAELASSDEYVETIDAIAQEQIWFDGAADNDPPGDCPLPRTEADIDTEAYYQNLSPKCRQQYDNFPESTLHVSSEEYLQNLTLAKDKGLLIFTVDYALEPENVAWIYETSRGLGFVPFVGSRALNLYLDPQ